MIGGELERVVVCTKLHPNASFSPPLFGLKKSGKWPKEEWKVAQRRLESGLKKVGKWPKEGRGLAAHDGVLWEIITFFAKNVTIYLFVSA